MALIKPVSVSLSVRNVWFQKMSILPPHGIFGGSDFGPVNYYYYYFFFWGGGGGGSWLSKGFWGVLMNFAPISPSKSLEIPNTPWGSGQWATKIQEMPVGKGASETVKVKYGVY